jgi:RhoGAP domain
LLTFINLLPIPIVAYFSRKKVRIITTERLFLIRFSRLPLWDISLSLVTRVYFNSTGTEVEGIFRINGSTKRMRELQTIFETPPRYGKNIQWQEHAFTPHDVASIFRRFLTYMPVSDLFYTPFPIFPMTFSFPFPSSYSLKLASERDETPLASQKPIHSNGRWPFPYFIPPLLPLFYTPGLSHNSIPNS